MHAISTLPSTKPRDGQPRDTVHPDDRAFRILYAPQVAVDVQRWGFNNADFLPMLEEIFGEPSRRCISGSNEISHSPTR